MSGHSIDFRVAQKKTFWKNISRRTYDFCYNFNQKIFIKISKIQNNEKLSDCGFIIDWPEADSLGVWWVLSKNTRHKFKNISPIMSPRLRKR